MGKSYIDRKYPGLSKAIKNYNKQSQRTCAVFLDENLECLTDTLEQKVVFFNEKVLHRRDSVLILNIPDDQMEIKLVLQIMPYCITTLGVGGFGPITAEWITKFHDLMTK